MSDAIVKTLEQRLPPEWRRIQWENELRDGMARFQSAFDQSVAGQPYSSDNAIGAYEFGVALEPLQQELEEQTGYLASMDGHLSNISADTSAIREDTGVIRQHTQSIEQGTWANHAVLKAIRHGTDELPEIRKNIEIGNQINSANLAATVLGFGIMAKLQFETNERLSQLQDGIEDLKDGQYEMLENQGIMIDNQEIMIEQNDIIIDNQGVMIDQLGEITEGINTVIYGQEMIIDNQIVQIQNQQIMSKQLANIDRNIVALANVMNEGFTQLREGQIELYLQQQAGIEVMHGNFQDLLQQNHKYHQENLVQRNRIAETWGNLRAREKYSQACMQYHAKGYLLALDDLSVSLLEDSTFLPSLLLLGQIGKIYTQWASAKDIYFHTSKLAIQQEGQKKAYEAAILGLVAVEKIVGNRDKAKEILRESVSGYRQEESFVLRREYIKMEMEDYGS